MRCLFILLAIGAVLVTPLRAAYALEDLIVVELFTSQGCSSCPAADALLEELSQREDVLALSQHVAYWDYIGWQDPFALPQTAARQHDYAKVFNLRYVYTPQIVVQGQHEVAGSNRDGVLAAIGLVGTAHQPAISLRATASGDFEVILPAAADVRAADVIVVGFDRHHRTQVLRGENRGRTLDNHHVVRYLNVVGTWRGAPETLKISLDINALPGDQHAVLVQEQGTMRILCARKMKL